MGSRLSGVGLSLTLALVVGSCGGDPSAPEAAKVSTVTGVETDADVTVSASARVRQRWVVEDACNEGRGTRVRLFDLTAGRKFPGGAGYWLVENGETINRVIECRVNDEICLGAVQDPPPGLAWGVGYNAEHACRYPSRCCFSCTRLAHKLTLSCATRRSLGLAEPEGEILPEAEGSFE